MTERVWVLGAQDPEMNKIEHIVRSHGERVEYARIAGERVHPGNAYRFQEPVAEHGTQFLLVECAPAPANPVQNPIVFDHHRALDPGYGRPPEQFLEASSIGQVMAELERLEVIGDRDELLRDHDVLFVAAADHCLEAAYRGRCPGVSPDELMRWRLAQRAAFQGRSIEAVLADVEAARKILRAAVGSDGFCRSCHGTGVADTEVCDGCQGTGETQRKQFADLRGQHIPELPEAACREGIPFLATLRDKDGREKIVLQAAPPDLVRYFMAGLLGLDLIDIYGDPSRGFAGGYLSK